MIAWKEDQTQAQVSILILLSKTFSLSCFPGQRLCDASPGGAPMGRDLVPVAPAPKQPGNRRLLRKSPTSFSRLPCQEPSCNGADGREASGHRAGIAVRSHCGLPGILCRQLCSCGCGTAPDELFPQARGTRLWIPAWDTGPAGRASSPHAVAPRQRCAGMRSPGAMVTSHWLRAAAAGSPFPKSVGLGVWAGGKHTT